MEEISKTEANPLEQNGQKTKRISGLSKLINWFKSKVGKLWNTLVKVTLIQVEERLSVITSIFLRIGLLILIFGLFFLLYQELKNDSYILRAFQVPKAFEYDGYSGVVVANKLLDKVTEIQQQAVTMKETAAYTKKSEEAVQDLQIMGVGFSINSLAYQIRHALGIDQTQISGELVNHDSVLSLTLRMTDTNPITFHQSFIEITKHQALDSLIQQAGEKVMEMSEPYQLAVYFDRKLQYEKALEMIKKTISTQPDERQWAYNLWGNILRSSQIKKYKESIKRYQQAIELDENYPLPWTNWGHLLVEKRQYEEAIQKFNASLKIQESVDVRVALGNVYMSMKQYEKAQVQFKKAIDLDHKIWWPYLRLSHAYLELGDFKSSREALKQGIEIDPSNPELIHNYASTLCQLGDVEEGLSYFERGLELNKDHLELRINYSVVLANAGKYEKALNIAYKLLEENPNTPFGNFFLAYIYVLTEQPKNARKYLNASFEIAPNEAYNYMILAAIEEFEGNKERFYVNVDSAFSKGFNEPGILQEKPFKHYQTDQRYQEILKKYDWIP
ncbi:MAG: tetratricopeptide repeat protein [Flammeovirgaceae bacterium]